MAFGTPAMVIGIIGFLVWFTTKHTKEHRVILDRMDSTDTREKAIAEDIANLYKMSLRSCIVNNEIPVSARLEMYDTYKSKGFNSWVDQYVEDNLFHTKDESK